MEENKTMEQEPVTQEEEIVVENTKAEDVSETADQEEAQAEPETAEEDAGTDKKGFFHSCSAFLFMKNIVQLIHKSLQRSHNVLIIHSFGTDDTYRSLKSIPQFICGSYHTAVLHALYW